MKPFRATLAKTVTSALYIFIVLPALVFGLLYLFQEKMIFPGRGQSQSMKQWADERYPGTEVDLTSPDGTRLHGWFVRQGGEGPLPLFVYFGGNAEDVSYNLRDIHRLQGWAVLLMSYRGYGLSHGRPMN